MIMAFSFIDSKITINHPKHFWYESCNKRIYEEIAKFEINQWEDSILKGSPLIGWRFGFLSRLTEWGGGCESDWVGERLRDCGERRWECHLAEIWFIFQSNLPRWQIGLGVLHINQTTFTSWEPSSLLILYLKNDYYSSRMKIPFMQINLGNYAKDWMHVVAEKEPSRDFWVEFICCSK